MSNKEATYILFPVGRLVEGSLYEPNTTDAEGRPLVFKSGPDQGKPRVEYYIGVAIPKSPGVTHWAQEKGWGETIWNLGHAAWPQGQAQRPDFAWKILDGDSTIPNKKGRKPCEREGFPGHWIVKFGGGTQPKIVNSNGTQPITEPNAIRPGYYVQVYGSVKSNESTQTAGMYVNHSIVALSAYGPEIQYGPDAASVGFGAAPLPPGASPVPLGGMTTPANGAAPPPPPAPSPAPGVASPSPGVASASPPPPPAPTPAPNTAFVQNAAGAPPPPPAQASAAAPPPPPVQAAPARTMTAAAGGATYESFIAQGWTDEAMIAAGYMTA